MRDRFSEAHVETQKVEMSPATITALRMMLREEVTAIEEKLQAKHGIPQCRHGDRRWKDGMDGQGWIRQCHCQGSNGRT